MCVVDKYLDRKIKGYRISACVGLGEGLIRSIIGRNYDDTHDRKHDL